MKHAEPLNSVPFGHALIQDFLSVLTYNEPEHAAHVVLVSQVEQFAIVEQFNVPVYNYLLLAVVFDVVFVVLVVVDGVDVVDEAVAQANY